MLRWFHQNCLCFWMSTQSHVLTVPIAFKNDDSFIECIRLFGLCPVSICVFLLSSCPPPNHWNKVICILVQSTNVFSQEVASQKWETKTHAMCTFKIHNLLKNQSSKLNSLIWKTPISDQRFAPCTKFSTCPRLSHTWPHRKAQSERPHDSERSPLEALGHSTSKTDLYM